MTRARMTHARITNVRDYVEDYARRRARAATATPTPPRRCRRRARARWETTGGDDEREAGVRDDARASDTRARYKRAQ